ncbi:MAG: peptide ABC transporter substrate-binding protein [Clostridia bacterium]|nr:peptide ABC transporter substrate-binding protein [Clostridia bacterium]
MKKILCLALAVVMLLCATGCAKGGKSATPTLNYIYNTNDAHKAIAEYVQSAYANVGITMNLENQEWNTFLNTRKNGEYAVARNGWIADYNDPICFLDMWTSGSGNNDVQFGKGAHKDLKMYSIDLTKFGGDKVEKGTWAETYDVLISKIKTTTDAAARYELMHMAEDMLMATGCLTPIYYYTDLYMIDDTVKGFFSNPLGYKYFMNTTVDGKTDNINVCLASEPDTLDPALNSAVDGATMLAHLFSGLAKWAQVDGKLTIVADAAKELVKGVTNDDGTVTYTYTLRDGLKWSNGDELKASDFEKAWKRAASTELGADYGYMFEVIKGYGTDEDLAVTADDAAKTITVTLANSISYWDELLAFPTYFPVHSSALNSDKWATEANTYICNGPYVIDSWAHDSLITLKKNTNYIDAAKVSMEKISCYLSDDANNMLTNFKKGDWQLIDDVPTNEIANLKKDFADEFVVAGQIGTYYICWNVNFDLLPESDLDAVAKEEAQQEIRQAMGLLLDRNYIVNSVSQGGEIPASTFVAMGMTDADGSEFYKNSNKAAGNNYVGYFDASTEAYEGNVNKAVEILSKYYELDIAK